ncbi:MAG: hypothetical protein ACLFVJ_02605 [Persicimonas sp.]
MPANRVVVAASFLAVALILAPGLAEAADLAVGAKVGANWSLLSKPTDPAGEPTLLSGSAFDGVGFTGGAAVYYPLAELHGATLEFESGLLFSRHSGEGFEERTDTGEQRYVTLNATIARVPLLVHLRDGQSVGGFRVGVGLEPMLGLQSGATVEHRNSSAEPEPLETTPTTHMGATIALGFDWPGGTDWSIPVDFRATWDPFVPDSTRDRFEGFESAEDTGEYQVGYNWQLFVMTGFRYEL